MAGNFDAAIRLLMQARDESMSSTLKTVGGAFSGLGGIVQGALSYLTGTLMRDAVDMVRDLGKEVVGMAGEFQSSMSTLSIAASSTGLSFDDLQAAAMAVGGDTRLVGVSASGAADSLTGLFKAGLTATEVFGDLNGYMDGTAELGGALRAAIDLAAATELDMVQASDLAAVALASFGGELETEEERAAFVTAAMNNMVQAADASVAEVSDLAAAMANLAPTAASLGISIEDTNNALALLSTRGIAGAEAGTALKSMLTNMMRQTPAVTDALQQLGIQLYDNEGVMRSLPDIIGQFESALSGSLTTYQRANQLTAEQSEALKLAQAQYDKAAKAIQQHQLGLQELDQTKLESYQWEMERAKIVIDDLNAAQGDLIPVTQQLTDEQRAYYIQTIAGTYGMNAMNVLLGEGVEGWNAMATATAGAATIQEQAAAKAATFEGQMEALEGTIETLKIGIGTALLPVLTELAAWASGMIEQYGPQLQAAFDVIAAAITRVVDVLMGFMNGETNLADILPPEVVPLFQAFQATLDRLGEWWAEYGPLITEIAGNLFAKLQETIQTLVSEHLPWVQEKLELFGTWFEENGPLIVSFAQTIGDVLGWMLDQVGGYMELVRAEFDLFLNVFLGLVTLIMQVATGDWAGAWATIQQVAIDVVEGIKNVLIAWIDWVAGWFGSDWAGVVELWNNIWTAIADFFVGIWEWIATTAQSVWTSISDFFTSIFTAISDFFVGLWTDIVAFFVGIWESLTTTATESTNAVQTTITDVFTAISTFFSEIWATIQGVFDTVLAYIDELVGDQFRSILASITEILTEVWDFVRDVWEQLIQPKIEEVLSAISAFITETMTAISTFWSETWTAISTFLSETWAAIWATITEVASAIWSTITTIFSAVAAWWAETWNAISTKASEIWIAISTMITAITTAIRSTLERWLLPLKMWWDRTWTEIKARLLQLWDQMKAAIQERLEALRAKISEKIQAAKNAITSIDWAGIGRAMINGIARGVMDKAKHLADKAASAVRNAIARARAAMGIHSPSSVAADELGAPLAEGIQVGFERIAPRMQEAMASGVKMATDSLIHFVAETGPEVGKELGQKIADGFTKQAPTMEAEVDNSWMLALLKTQESVMKYAPEIGKSAAQEIATGFEKETPAMYSRVDYAALDSFWQIGEAIQIVAQDVGQSAAKEIGSGFQSASSDTEQVQINSMEDWYKHLAEQAGETFPEVGETAAREISVGFMPAFERTSADMSSAAFDTMERVRDTVAPMALDVGFNIVDGIEGGFQDRMPIMGSAFREGTQDTLDSLRAVTIEEAPDIGLGLVNGITGAFQDGLNVQESGMSRQIEDAVSSVGEAVRDEIASLASWMQTETDDMWKDVVARTQQGRFDVQTELHSFITWVWSTWGSAYNNWMLEITTGMWAHVLTRTEAGTSALRDEIAGTVEWMRMNWQRLLSWLVEEVAKTLREIASAGWFGTGQSIVDGIGRGLMSRRNYLNWVMRRLMLDAVDAAQTAIQAGSPSRLASRELGQPLAQGVGQGLMTAMGDVESNFERMLTGLVGSGAGLVRGAPYRAALPASAVLEQAPSQQVNIENLYLPNVQEPHDFLRELQGLMR